MLGVSWKTSSTAETGAIVFAAAAMKKLSK
jgi:hypothetical protein